MEERVDINLIISLDLKPYVVFGCIILRQQSGKKGTKVAKDDADKNHSYFVIPIIFINQKAILNHFFFSMRGENTQRMGFKQALKRECQMSSISAFLEVVQK